jgi:hypothetical protein
MDPKLTVLRVQKWCKIENKQFCKMIFFDLITSLQSNFHGAYAIKLFTIETCTLV